MMRHYAFYSMLKQNFKSNIRSILGICIAMMTATPLWAADFHSPRSAALGGAGHAGPMLNDAIYLNPSFTSFLPSYSISANYGYFRGGDVTPDGSNQVHGRLLNGSIQDGRSDLFQAGVGFTQRDYGKILNVGASKAVIKELGLGIGGKWTFPNSPTRKSAKDTILSATFIADDWVHVVGIVDNVFSTDEGRAQGLYREYIVGTKFNIKGIVMLYLDPHLSSGVPNESSFGYEAGVEFSLMKDLFLRAGSFRNSNVPEIENTRGRGYGLGAGWISPRISFDYGMKRLVDPIGSTTHNFGFTIFM